MRTLAIAVLLAALGCGKAEDQKPAPVSASTPCMEVGTAMAKVYAEQIAAAKTEADRERMTKLGAYASARLALRCQEDAWSPEAIACAKTGKFDTCESKLTAEQLSKLQADAKPIAESMPIENK
ncbi:MAG: hypothetical protein JWP01_1325 [Myxococcales bacterium]|nr:hypothetical protein [Myxococcales bacterium]